MGELESEIICTFEKIVEPQELNCFLHTCGCERCNMFNCTSDLNVCNNAQSLLSAIIFRNKRFMLIEMLTSEMLQKPKFLELKSN